jgi:hypothetical protein
MLQRNCYQEAMLIVSLIARADNVVSLYILVVRYYTQYEHDLRRDVPEFTKACVCTVSNCE